MHNSISSTTKMEFHGEKTLMVEQHHQHNSNGVATRHQSRNRLANWSGIRWQKWAELGYYRFRWLHWKAFQWTSDMVEFGCRCRIWMVAHQLSKQLYAGHCSNDLTASASYQLTLEESADAQYQEKFWMPIDVCFGAVWIRHNTNSSPNSTWGFSSLFDTCTRNSGEVLWFHHLTHVWTHL